MTAENFILILILVAALAYLGRKATGASKAFGAKGGCKTCGCGEKSSKDSTKA